MINFVTIAIVVCTLNVSNKHPKDLFCYDKGIENLRATDIASSSPFDFYKCTDKYMKNCNTEFSKMDGCKFILKDKTVYYSSLTCP